MQALRLSKSFVRGCTYLQPRSRRAVQNRGGSRTWCSASTVDAEVTRLVSESSVVVYSKTYCPYCSAVKDLFKSLDVEHVVVELDNLDDGEAIQAALHSRTGVSTVPQVFVKGKFIGGCDDMYAARSSGQLKRIFEADGVKSTL